MVIICYVCCVSLFVRALLVSDGICYVNFFVRLCYFYSIWNNKCDSWWFALNFCPWSDVLIAATQKNMIYQFFLPSNHFCVIYFFLFLSVYFFFFFFFWCLYSHSREVFWQITPTTTTITFRSSMTLFIVAVHACW